MLLQKERPRIQKATRPVMQIVPGERVILRVFRWSDVLRYTFWAQEKEVQRYFAPILSSEDPRWLFNLWKKPATDIMAIFGPVGSNGKMHHIGGIGFQDIDYDKGDAEFGFAIGRQKWRDQGYGTDALRALLWYAFSVLELKSVYGRVLASNGRALHILREKIGFVDEGVQKTIRTKYNGQVNLHLLRIKKEQWESVSR